MDNREASTLVGKSSNFKNNALYGVTFEPMIFIKVVNVCHSFNCSLAEKLLSFRLGNISKNFNVNNNAVYTTAPATPGMSKTYANI